MKKILEVLIILIALFIIGMGLIFYLDKDMVAVLGYHGVLPKELNTSGDMLITDLEKFEEELKILKKLGYKSMTLDEFYCWQTKKCKKEGKRVLITFDDGYKNNEYAFKLLKEYDMTAVVFLVGLYHETNDLFIKPDELARIKVEYPNIEFASHSYNLHHHSDFTYDEIVDDITKMKTIIDSPYYAYPFGDYNNAYVRALNATGYKMAFTFGPGSEHRKASRTDGVYTIPRLNISNDMSYLKFILRLILPI